jgi:predicted Fe-S protein YdhL (DUF1289 family)
LGKKDKERIPSPCIDICEDLRGVCIACGRVKKDKKAWKKAKTEAEKLAMIEDTLEKVAAMGTRDLWLREYQRKCIKKGAVLPLALLEKLALEPAGN